MILTPSEQIAQRIYDGLPYIHEVQVHKRFPTTIRLEITECQPAAVITGAASAWLVDANGKLLEAADDTMKQEYPNVTGLELLEPKQGKQAATTDENQSKLKGLVALTQALSDCGLMEGRDVHRRLFRHGNSSGLPGPPDHQAAQQRQLREEDAATADGHRPWAGDDGKGIINMKGTDKVIWTKQN